MTDHSSLREALIAADIGPTLETFPGFDEKVMRSLYEGRMDRIWPLIEKALEAERKAAYGEALDKLTVTGEAAVALHLPCPCCGRSDG